MNKDDAPNPANQESEENATGKPAEGAPETPGSPSESPAKGVQPPAKPGPDSPAASAQQQKAGPPPARRSSKPPKTFLETIAALFIVLWGLASIAALGGLVFFLLTFISKHKITS